MSAEPSGDFSGLGLEALLSRLGDGVAFLDPLGRILLTNRADRLPGQPASIPPTALDATAEIFHPDGRSYEPADWPIVRSLQGGDVVGDDECVRRGQDGSRTTFNCSSAPIFGSDGQTVAGVLIARDISEQERSREQLAYLTPMLELTEDAIVAFDSQWRTVAWNKGAERMYGWSAQEVLGREMRSFMRVDQSDAENAASRVQVAESGTWRGRVTVERKDGTPLVIDAVAVAIHRPGGEITGYLGIHRDVTERKRANEQLASHVSLLDNVEDGVIATDADDFRITAWNRGAQRLYGFSAAEVIGSPAREVASYPGDASRFELERELDDSGRARIEFTAYRKDGTPVEVELAAVAVKDGDGQVTGYLGIHRDISERRRLTATVENAARHQALLADLSLRALSNGHLQEIMDDAVAVAAEVLKVDLSSIAVINPDGKLSWRAAFGWSEDEVASAPPSLAGRGSFVGYAVLVGEPVISDDVMSDERFVPSPLFAKREPVSAAAVVIPGPRDPVGVLTVAARRPHSFDSDDVKFMQAVANIVGIAIERDRADNRIEAAREAERGRIARDLHDEGLRELTDALAVATVSRSTSSGKELERWAGLIVSLQLVGQQLRSAIYDLRLGGWEERPFAELLGEMVAIESAMAGATRIERQGFEALPGRPLGYRGSEALRVLREAITNARRHSGATTIRVDARRSTEDVLCVEVGDDGVWPDRGAALSGRAGTGIMGMMERADLLGAELQIEDRPGGGTRVLFELKLGGVGNTHART